MVLGTAIEEATLQALIGEAEPIILLGVSTAEPGVHGAQRIADYSSGPLVTSRPPGTDISFWEIIRDSGQEAGFDFEGLCVRTDLFYSFLTEQELLFAMEKYRIDEE